MHALIHTILLAPWLLMAHSQQQSILEHTNNLRATHRSAPVTWDTTLETSSQTHASYLSKLGRLEHSDGPYGENLAYFSSDSDPVRSAINLWYAEVAKYDYNQPGYNSATGHFTQLVWNASRRVGAAVARDERGRSFVVMRFVPAGNMLGRFEQNVFRPVTLSPSALPSPPPASASIASPPKPPTPKASPSYKQLSPPSPRPNEADDIRAHLPMSLLAFVLFIFALF
jgi:glioma pathogenesis-related protein 2